MNRFDLLVELLGSEVVMSRIVFDPEDDSTMDDAVVSELTKGIRYHSRLALAADASSEQREQARTNAERIAKIRHYAADDTVTITDMSAAEWTQFAQLTSHTPDPSLKLVSPLGAGEAACIAIAVHRGYTIATDDTDALRVLRQLSPQHPYERIRKLLIRAGEEQMLTTKEANTVHEEMRQQGFWDRTAPFPDT